MYFEYWGLKKPPFDNVPDPAMHVDCHESQGNAIAETLFSIEEGNECIAVIIGDVGLGKTLSLRIIIDSLDHEKYRIAFITNPDMSFIQLLREIIGQITGKQCEIRKKVDLLEEFNKILFETLREGQKVLVFIDEANALSPKNLESLRLLTNMQDDKRNLLTIILAGQIELARRLEHPRRANLFQRIGTYSWIKKIESEKMVKAYVQNRIRLAGGTGEIFTDDAYECIWELSEHGVPRLINKTCKLCLKAGETNNLSRIDGSVVKAVGERFNKYTARAVQRRKPRKRTVNKNIQRESETVEEDVIVSNSVAEPGKSEIKDDVHGMEVTPQMHNKNPIDSEEKKEEVSAKEEFTISGEVGEYKISINVPSDLLAILRSSDDENERKRIAGVLAAQTLKESPELTASSLVDPVSVWSEIRDLVLSETSEAAVTQG